MAALAASAAFLRLLPHPPNFSTIGGLALFGAAHFDRRRHALLVPLLAMAASDVALEAMHRLGWRFASGFHDGMGYVYLAFVLVTLLGLALRRSKHPLRVGGVSLLSSVVFFVVTNLGVWLGGYGYAHTWDGLVECFTLAIPFFQYTLAGDLCTVAVLFGGFALAQKYVPRLRAIA